MCQGCELAREVIARPSLLTTITVHISATFLIINAWLFLLMPQKMAEYFRKLVNLFKRK
jgi:hypothetical protein